MATLGNTTALSSTIGVPNNTVYCVLYTSDSTGGTVDSGFIYAIGINNCKVVIYDTSYRVIGLSNPIADTSSFRSVRQWYSVDFSQTVTIQPNTNYYIGVVPNANLNLSYLTSGSARFSKLNSYTNPTNITSPSTGNGDISVYVTYNDFATDFTDSQKLTIDNTKVSGSADHTDFPVLVTGDQLPSALFSGAQSTGADIRFSSDSAGTIPLDYELVSYDSATSSAQIWVKIPTLSYNTDTDFYVWWGNSSVTSASSGANTFSGSEARYHLDTITDDAKNSFDLVNNGTATTASVQINNGADFGASNTTKYLSNSSLSTLTADLRLKVWAQNTTAPGTGAYQTIIAQQTGGNNYQINYENASGTLRINVWRVAQGVVVDAVTYNLNISTSPTMLDLVYSGTTLKLYTDGVLRGSTTATANGSGGSVGLTIGSDTNAGTKFSGKVDEVDVRNSAVSDDWIATEYNNQDDPDTFFKSSAGPTTQTQSFSSKASIVNTSKKDLSSKSNIVTSKLFDINVKSNIFATTINNFSSKASIIKIEQKDYFSKSNIVIIKSFNVSFKSNISNTLVNNYFSKSNIVRLSFNNFLSKANIIRSQQKSYLSKSNILVTNQFLFNSKASVANTIINEVESIGNIVKTKKLDFSAKASISGISQFNFSSKGNILVTDNSFDLNAKASIKKQISSDYYSKSNITTTRSFNINAKSNILNTVVNNYSSKSNITRLLVSSFNSKANIIVRTTVEINAKSNISNQFAGEYFTKASISSTTVNNISSKASVVAINSNDIDVKSNILNQIFNDFSVKSSIYNPTTNDLSVRSNIVTTTTKNLSVRAQIISEGASLIYVKSNIVRKESQQFSSKSNISISQLNNIISKANILRIEISEIDIIANIKAIKQSQISSKASITGINQINFNVKGNIFVADNIENISAKASIKLSSDISVFSKANITIKSISDIYAKSSILETKLNSIISKANISIFSDKDINAKSNITLIISNNISVKSQIVDYKLKNILVKADITPFEEDIFSFLVKANIKLVGLVYRKFGEQIYTDINRGIYRKFSTQIYKEKS